MNQLFARSDACRDVRGSGLLRVAFVVLATLGMRLSGGDVPPAAAADNAAAIKEFGIDPGPRLDRGIVFIETAYLPPPYAVERRGLGILINGHLVFAGCEWPPFDPSVPNDPGDPPKGLAPTDEVPGDHRMGYWSRKARYLITHFDRATACARMGDTLRATGFYQGIKISADPLKDPFITLVAVDGHQTNIDFWGDSAPPEITDPKRALKVSSDIQRQYADDLRSGCVIGFSGAAQVGYYGTPSTWRIDTLHAQPFLDILAQSLSPLVRLDALRTKELVNRGDTTNDDILQRLVVDERLRRRMIGFAREGQADQRSPDKNPANP
jgi:hypothetical protein